MLTRHRRTERRRGRSELPPEPLGVLEDGTPFYVPLGELRYDSELDAVQCHLCARWLRLITRTHLGQHGSWTVAEYKQAMGLALRRPLCTPSTLEKHSENARRRLETDPVFRAGLEHALAVMRTAAGQDLRRQALTGRRLTIDHIVKASGNKSLRARQRRIEEADEFARGQGFPAFDAYWRDRCERGFTFRAIAREVGRTNWWVRRVAEELEKPPQPRSPACDRAEIQRALIEEHAVLGHWPSVREWQKGGYRPCHKTILNHFGGWRHALDSAAAVIEAAEVGA